MIANVLLIGYDNRVPCRIVKDGVLVVDKTAPRTAVFYPWHRVKEVWLGLTITGEFWSDHFLGV
jgi:hypothetical protein